MNRLRFRVWDKVNKEMIEDVASIHFKAKMISTYNLFFYPFKDIELLQSTGLFDKNGMEIYEGDIVKNEINEVGYIEWSKCRFNFCDSVGHFCLFSIGARQPFEILGNIYEHPHLLGEDTQ